MIYLQFKISQLLKTCVYWWIHHYKCIKNILEITYYIKKIKLWSKQIEPLQKSITTVINKQTQLLYLK